MMSLERVATRGATYQPSVKSSGVPLSASLVSADVENEFMNMDFTLPLFLRKLRPCHASALVVSSHSLLAPSALRSCLLIPHSSSLVCRWTKRSTVLWLRLRQASRLQAAGCRQCGGSARHQAPTRNWLRTWPQLVEQKTGYLMICCAMKSMKVSLPLTSSSDLAFSRPALARTPTPAPHPPPHTHTSHTLRHILLEGIRYKPLSRRSLASKI